jgi:hypothetical protein
LRSLRSSRPARPNRCRHVRIARRARHCRQPISCRMCRRSRLCRRTIRQSRRSRQAVWSGPIAASPAGATSERPYAPISESPARPRRWSACAASPRRRRGKGIDGLACVPKRRRLPERFSLRAHGNLAAYLQGCRRAQFCALKPETLRRRWAEKAEALLIDVGASPGASAGEDRLRLLWVRISRRVLQVAFDEPRQHHWREGDPQNFCSTRTFPKSASATEHILSLTGVSPTVRRGSRAGAGPTWVGLALTEIHRGIESKQWRNPQQVSIGGLEKQACRSRPDTSRHECR